MAEVFAQMRQQLNAQTEQLNAQEKQRQADAYELAYARLKIQLLEERLRQMRIAKYGKASEKLSDLQLELLEAEPGVSREEVIAESERDPLAESSPAIDNESASQQQRDKKKHPGRQTLPAYLTRVEKIITCAPDQCICGGCGKETTVIGYEKSEVLDVKPAE
jgi:hypothetical protein